MIIRHDGQGDVDFLLASFFAGVVLACRNAAVLLA
jgi:hypothetical protein